MVILILVIIILLIVIVILLIRNTSVITTTAITDTFTGNNIITTTSHKLNIISKDSSELQEYCTSWGYDYNNASMAHIKCYLYEKSLKPNNDQSMSLLLQLVSNCSYIAFNNTSSYLANSKITRAEIDMELLNIELAPEIVTKILDNGYPCLTKSGMLLSRAYLDYIFKGEPLPFVIPHYMPQVIPARVEATVSRIPKVIHQTFETPLLPQSLHNAIHTWLIRNPEYELRYYSDRDRRDYIKKYFDDIVLRAYDKVIPGAYRADLWRYCVIYNEGGVYADIKLGPFVPLSNIINDNTELVVVNDDQLGALLNGFFAAAPKHKALYKAIMLATERILADEYGNHPIYPTGPSVLGAAVLPYYKMKDKMTTLLSDVVALAFYHEDDKLYIKDIKGRRLIVFRHSTEITEASVETITGRPHYRVLWKNREVYRH